MSISVAPFMASNSSQEMQSQNAFELDEQGGIAQPEMVSSLLNPSKLPNSFSFLRIGSNWFCWPFCYFLAFP